MGNVAVNGYTDIIGKHGAWVGDHTGPASYTTGGETIQAINFGLRSLDFVEVQGVSLSGNYTISVPTISSLGAIKQMAKLLWRYSAVSGGVTGAAVTVSGTGIVNGTYLITATTGSAQIKVVVAGGVLSSVTVVIPGGGYVAAPTFTPPAGLGNTASITATIGTVSGIEVASGTNLSGESVRILAIGG